MILEEEGIEFDFGKHKATKLDVQGVPLPEGMALTDFFVEREKDSLLLEVKDFANPRMRPAQEKENKGKIILNEFINKHLVPKCRDSYTYIHLMERDKRPLIYVVLLVMKKNSIDTPLLLDFSERLVKRLYHEAHEPWKKRFVKSCHVVNQDNIGLFGISIKRK
jgi:hypothetical protein